MEGEKAGDEGSFLALARNNRMVSLLKTGQPGLQVWDRGQENSYFRRVKSEMPWGHARRQQRYKPGAEG